VDAPVAEAAGQDATEDAEVSVGGTVTLEARVVLKCQDCGTELAESTITTEQDFDHTCDPEGLPEADYDPSGDQFEVQDPEPEGTSRQEDKDRNGKPIKKARYMKTFYGFEAEVDVTCRKCGEIFQVSVSGEDQASSFSECQ
jgi:ribosomal protein S27E